MKYIPPTLGSDGWSDWIQPLMTGYRLACCDCGLVHELCFRVIKHGRGHKVLFKAARHNRATAAKRRHRRGER